MRNHSDANMASSREQIPSDKKVKYEETKNGFYVANLSGKETFKLEALRKGEPELCLLIPSEKPIKAAEEYA